MKKVIFKKKKHLFLIILVISIVIFAVIYAALLLTYRSEICWGAGMLTPGKPENKISCRFSYLNSHSNMTSELAIKLRMKSLCNLTLGYETPSSNLTSAYTADICKAKYDAMTGGILACQKDNYFSCFSYVVLNPISSKDCTEIGKDQSPAAREVEAECRQNLGKPEDFHLLPE